MPRFEQKMKKIGYSTQGELADQINKLEAYAVLSVDNNVIPESTDGRNWVEVHFLVQK